MEYKLINNYEKNTPVLEQVLINRNIKNKDKYFNLDSSVLLSPYLLENIELASDILIKHLKNNSKILIIVDSDCDGYTSAAALYNYLIISFPEIENNIDFIVHKEKMHKIIINDYILKNYQLICVPDAGSNDFEEHKILNNNNIDLIILDHHQVEKDFFNNNEHFAIVNNQISKNYTNKMISGVGIVWKFLQVLDNKLKNNYANLFLDLVAVGMAADMQSLQEEETAFLIREGLKEENIINPFIKTLIAHSSFTIKNPQDMNYTTVSFNIAPFINAITRIGTLDEKILLFSSMLFNCAYRLVPSTKRGSKNGDVEILVEQSYRVCNNVKNRQNKLKEESLSIIQKNLLLNYDLINEKSIILNINNILDKNLIGLVANEIASEYQKPTVLLNYNEETEELIGSMRGYDKSELKNFKTVLENCEGVNWVKGHLNAAGCSIEKDKIDIIKNNINEQLKNINFNIQYDIDYILDFENMDKQFIVEQILNVGSKSFLWGKGCEEPYILFTNIIVPISKIHLLNKGTLKIEINDNISAIKFNVKEEEYEKIISGNEIKNIKIIGCCNINNWQGKKQPQIKIIDYCISIPEKKWIF